jgi:hypothetical protein
VSTAIVSEHIPDGFVVGADGRRKDGDLIASDTTQKLFGVNMGKLRLAFAWTGNARLEDKNGRTLLDFKYLTDEVLQSVDMTSVNQFSDVIQLFNERLLAILKGTSGSPDIFPANEVASVLFVAYFYDQPCKAEITVNRGQDTVFTPRITALSVPAPFGYRVFTGSQAAFKLSDLGLGLPSSLQEAATRVRDYIRLCFTHRDPPLDCANPIGGHIHIGQLTPKQFLWIDPPQ